MRIGPIEVYEPAPSGDREGFKLNVEISSENVTGFVSVEVEIPSKIALEFRKQMVAGFREALLQAERLAEHNAKVASKLEQ